MEMMNSLLELNLKVGLVSMVGLLGWLYVGDDDVSLNEQMIMKDMHGNMMVVQNRKTLKNYVKYVGLLAHY